METGEVKTQTMGTDIEFCVERRESNEWVSCDTWTRNPDPAGFLTGQDFLVDTCWGDREYDVFSILAGVRSTGDYTAIAPLRELPDDMSENLATHARDRVGDGWGHSPSWLTLAEILAFDWDQHITLEGYARASHFHRWVCSGRREAGMPPPDLFKLIEVKELGHALLSEEEIFERTEPIGNPYETKRCFTRGPAHGRS